MKIAQKANKMNENTDELKGFRQTAREKQKKRKKKVKSGGFNNDMDWRKNALGPLVIH